MDGDNEDDDEAYLELAQAVCNDPANSSAVFDMEVEEVERVVSKNVVGTIGGMDPRFLEFLETNARMQQRMLETMSNLSSKEAEERATAKKRKTMEDYHPEEVRLFDESVQIVDNGHNILDFVVRQKLRPINSDPSVYWKKHPEGFKQVERPIVGALFMEHLMPGSIHEATLCKFHDRGAIVQLKNFLSKNSGVKERERKKAVIQTDDVGRTLLPWGSRSLGPTRRLSGSPWSACSTCWPLSTASGSTRTQLL
jgi:hypothetical protein